MTKAAEKHAEVQAAAAGDEASKAGLTQLLGEKQKDPQIAYGYTRPQEAGGEMITALLPVGIFGRKSEFANSQMAIAGSLAAGDLVATAGVDPPMALRNLDCLAGAVSERGAGFRDPDRMSAVPWSAQVTRRRGADSIKQLAVFLNRWALANDAPEKEIREALRNAAFFQTRLRMAAYRLTAFDVQMAGAIVVTCAGFSPLFHPDGL